MYHYGYGRHSLSSLPSHLTAPNGLNFVRSVSNPNSRLNKVRTYLMVNGRATKRDILRDVFGKIVSDDIPFVNRKALVDSRHALSRAGEVTRGWGAYLFGYGIRHGFFKKERIGNKVFYSLP